MDRNKLYSIKIDPETAMAFLLDAQMRTVAAISLTSGTIVDQATGHRMHPAPPVTVMVLE